MASTSRSLGRRIILGAFGGAAFGALLSAVLTAYSSLAGSVLGNVSFLEVAGLGALAGLGASAGFQLARPAHATRQAWVWWALGLPPLGVFYGALLGVGTGTGDGLVERLGALALIVVLAVAMMSAAIVIGHSVALLRGGGAVSRGALAVVAGVVCGGAAGLGFGLTDLATLRPVCQPHQYCLEPDPARILQTGLLIGAILGLLLGVAAVLAVAASAARHAGADFQAPHANGVTGA